jgi:hypothetical protein
MDMTVVLGWAGVVGSLICGFSSTGCYMKTFCDIFPPYIHDYEAFSASWYGFGQLQKIYEDNGRNH